MSQYLNKIKADFFDQHAEDSWSSIDYSEEEIGKLKKLVDRFGIISGSRILEPGCGTGRLTKFLANIVGKTGYVQAFDISPKMIAAGKRALREYSHVAIICDAIENYSFDRDSFDFIFCHQVFPHFDDKKLALATMIPALKQNGKLIIYHFEGSEWINDVHRKAGTVVMDDMIPDIKTITNLLSSEMMKIDCFEDNKAGYLLCATKV